LLGHRDRKSLSLVVPCREELSEEEKRAFEGIYYRKGDEE
jgi:hypothetical protein